NMPATDLGVLKDMPGIRDKANSKLVLREEQYSGMLLSAYKEMVRQLSYLVEASHSMRCFSKAAPNYTPHINVYMFYSEQKLKRLLLLEFLSIALKEGVELETSLNWGDELYDGESNELQSIGLQSGDAYSPPENWCAERLGSQRPGNLPLHEMLFMTNFVLNMTLYF
ncbi:hypothetical protein ACJX0J_024350, partial [Zea mays]